MKPTDERLHEVSDLLKELCDVCEMIGYATIGNERNNHRSDREKIKQDILAIFEKGN